MTSEDCSPATAMHFGPSACTSDTHQFVNTCNKKLCTNKDQLRGNKINNIILEKSLPGKARNTLSLHNDWSSAHKNLKIRDLFRGTENVCHGKLENLDPKTSDWWSIETA